MVKLDGCWAVNSGVPGQCSVSSWWLMMSREPLGSLLGPILSNTFILDLDVDTGHPQQL